MQQELAEKFKELMSNHMGMRIREQDFDKFVRIISNRMKDLNINSYEQYYDFISKWGGDVEKEWKKLSVSLTTSETFFFRDKGQFSLLEDKLIPKLLQKRAADKTLRLWSAGCSTGEEPYSLAMLLYKLIPDIANWKIFILGTDINEEALAKARSGIYTQWSFRMFDKELIEQYFHEIKNGWELDSKIKRMVTFEYGNLKRDDFPNGTSLIHDMDIILCRNVFIYFDTESVTQVLKKIGKSLTSVGYFITGHAELYGQKLENLKPKFFPESVVYQAGQSPSSSYYNLAELESNFKKIEDNLRNIPPLNIAQPQTPIPVKKPEKIEPPTRPKPKFYPKPEKKEEPEKLSEEMVLEVANSLFKKGKYWDAIKTCEKAIKNGVKNSDIIFITAQSYANLGNHKEAVAYCEKALNLNPYCIRAYFLLAQIAEENGEIEESKNFFNKIIYLDPNFVPAYLEIAAIFERENNLSRAKKLRSTALNILQKLPADQKIEPYDNLRAGELLDTVKQLLH